MTLKRLRSLKAGDPIWLDTHPEPEKVSFVEWRPGETGRMFLLYRTEGGHESIIHEFQAFTTRLEALKSRLTGIRQLIENDEDDIRKARERQQERLAEARRYGQMICEELDP